MAKIDVLKWKLSKNEYHKQQRGIFFPGEGYQVTRRQHATTQGVTTCPCCDYVNDIYIWSFIGGGKRCGNCGVLLTYGGVIVYWAELEAIKKRAEKKKTAMERGVLFPESLDLFDNPEYFKAYSEFKISEILLLP
jgi:hypothetical protein